MMRSHLQFCFRLDPPLEDRPKRDCLIMRFVPSAEQQRNDSVILL